MKEMLQEYGRIIVSAIIIFIMIGLTVFFKGDYFINALSKLGVNTISYTLNGGTLPDDAVISYREYDEVVLPIPTSTNGTFEGWYETPDFTGEAVIRIEKGSTGNKTYYAKWNSESYAAVYGGTQLIFGIGAIPETYNGLELTAKWTGIETLQAGSFDAIPWKGYAEAITDVVVIDEIQPINTARWFEYFMNCSFMDLTKLNTSRVTSMSAMFYYAGYNVSSFNIIGMDQWDVSNVVYMDQLFWASGYSATTWSIGDIGGWNVSFVKDMYRMFRYAGNKTENLNLNLTSWDVSSVTNMSQMFWGAGYNATSVNLKLSDWNISVVKDMSNMFKGVGYESKSCHLDLSGWDTSSVTSMTSMFEITAVNSKSFSIIGLDDWDVSSVQNMSKMFYNSGRLSSDWSIGDLSEWDVSNVTNMSQMFYSYEGRGAAKNWSIGDISGWDTSNVTNMHEMFRYAAIQSTALNLDLSGWNVRKVTSYSNFAEGMGSRIILPVWGN